MRDRFLKARRCDDPSLVPAPAARSADRTAPAVSRGPGPAVVALFGAVFIVGSWSRGQESARIRVQTALVQVPVVVLDSQGRYLAGLSSGEFTLLDDGVQRPISFFLASDEPFSAALLLDTSKSTVTVLQDIRKAGLRFLNEMRPQDAAMVVAFDSAVHTACSLTSDRERLREAVRNTSVGDYVGTRLRDAVHEVTGRRFADVTGRKAILLLSDGQDYGSEVSEAGLLASVGQSNTVVYSVYYRVDPRDVMRKLFGLRSRMPSGGGGAEPWRDREREAEEFMRKLALDSGGSFHKVEATDLRKTFAAIAEELRHQYWLGFYPGTSRQDGIAHQLEVRVRRPGVVVRSRQSYRIY